MKKIVIASDAFKGSLNSWEVAKSAQLGVYEVFPDCQVIVLSVADGGEGMVDSLVPPLGGEIVCADVHDPLGRLVSANYGVLGDMAIMEVASACGLSLLSATEYNPWLTTSVGVGELIKDAINRGCQRFLVGLGGSATNDAGVGMLQALGYRFYDINDSLIEHGCGACLQDIVRIDDSMVSIEIRSATIVVACDVDAPFCGPEGAAPVFAPQKGADSEMVNRLDAGMASFAKVIADKYSVDIISIAGAGAAGGLGGAFHAFLRADLKKGIEVVLDAIDFDAMLQGADLVITGEGKLDFQTAKGKTAAGVLNRAKKQHIPVIAIGGCVEMCDSLRQMGFAGIYPILEEEVPLEVAMRPDFAMSNITTTVARVLKSLPS